MEEEKKLEGLDAYLKNNNEELEAQLGINLSSEPGSASSKLDISP